MAKLTCLLIATLLGAASAQFGLPVPAPSVPGIPGGVPNPLGRVLPLADIQKHITGQKGQLGSLIGLPNADTTSLASLFPAVGGAGAGKIAECYNSSMGAGQQAFDIFQNNVFDVVNQYYVSLEKEMRNSWN